MKVKGNAFKYGILQVLTWYSCGACLRSSKAEELAAHCMEDIDKNFVKK